jgi:hypothetical protein
MFITLDAAAGVPAGRQKSTADRACDQCKYVKGTRGSRRLADRCHLNTECVRSDVTWVTLARPVLAGA